MHTQHTHTRRLTRTLVKEKKRKRKKVEEFENLDVTIVFLVNTV